MMDCKHINELLLDYLYQELDPSQVESFEAHLKSCSRCASELASYERTRAIVKDLPEVEPPARIDDRILAEATRASQARPARAGEEASFWQRLAEGLRLLVMHPAMTAAVTLVLVLGVSFYVYRSSSPRSARETPDEPYTPEVDRRLPGGSATISVRERAADEVKAEDRKQEQAGPAGANLVGERADPVAPKEGLRVVAKRALRRGKGVANEEERKAEARGLMPETANVLGKAGSAASAEPSPTPAVATPAGQSPKDVLAAKAPKADQAPTRASKARDRESVDKNAGFAQKKLGIDRLAGALGKGGKGGGTPGRTSAAPKVALAPRKEAPRAKPTPVAAQTARPAKPRSGKGALVDDLDGAGDESKASYKGQLASKVKAPPSALAANEVVLGDQARAAGRCEAALAHYNRALSYNPKQLPALAGKVRACAAQLAKASDVPLLKAAKSYPALAGLLAPELERARRARAAAETEQVRGPKRAAKSKAKQAAPAKSDAYQQAPASK
jgi:anti-sigma factor RsiW